MQTLAQIADELYGLPLDEFTAARDASAREADDRDLARAVKALRKPSAAAWAINVLVRDRRAQLDEVLELGASLRTAQRDLDSRQLRTLTQQRRQLVAALAKQAADAAQRLGQRINAGAIEDVEQTLQAALADADAAEAVRTGRLVRALETVGFESVDLDGAVAGGGEVGSEASHDADRAAALARERRDAGRAADEAAHDLEEASAHLDEVARRAAEVSRSRMKLTARVDQLESRLADAREELSGVADDLKRIERDRDRAQKTADAAGREAERTARRLEELS